MGASRRPSADFAARRFECFFDEEDEDMFGDGGTDCQEARWGGVGIIALSCVVVRLSLYIIIVFMTDGITHVHQGNVCSTHHPCGFSGLIFQTLHTDFFGYTILFYHLFSLSLMTMM